MMPFLMIGGFFALIFGAPLTGLLSDSDTAAGVAVIGIVAMLLGCVVD